MNPFTKLFAAAAQSFTTFVDNRVTIGAVARWRLNEVRKQLLHLEEAVVDIHAERAALEYDAKHESNKAANFGKLAAELAKSADKDSVRIRELLTSQVNAEKMSKALYESVENLSTVISSMERQKNAISIRIATMSSRIEYLDARHRAAKIEQRAARMIGTTTNSASSSVSMAGLERIVVKDEARADALQAAVDASAKSSDANIELSDMEVAAEVEKRLNALSGTK